MPRTPDDATDDATDDAPLYAVGDVVVLNSGGPPMTVEETTTDMIRVVFLLGVEILSADFHPAMVRLVPPPYPLADRPRARPKKGPRP